MKIEDITTEVRPRTSWESIDLGLRMVQMWFKPIILSWLIFVLPICIVIYSVLYQHPFWSIFVIWWLKPIFARIPLYIVSHSVFGDVPSIRDIRKALPSIFKPHLIKMLLWYRLDPVRSFNLPVWQLEGLKGRIRAKRAGVLKKGVYGTAVSLTYFCIFIQFILIAACYSLLMMLLPSNVSAQDVTVFSFNEGSMVPGLILNIFVFISLSIIEPFYVAGGFALYLNRRTHLEAWDIELKFRSLVKRMTVNRLSSSRATKVISTIILIFFIGNSDLNIITAAQAKAADTHYTDMSNKQARIIVDKIMSSDEFNTKIKTKSWHVKEGLFENLFKEKKDNDKSKMLGFTLFGVLISVILGYILYFILGAFVFALVIFLAFKLLKYLPKGIFSFNATKTNDKKITAIFGLDLDPESLPDEVGQCAWELWQKEKYTAALSLLYRGSLSKLVNRDGVKLPYSATEGDCIKILKTSHIKENSELINYFESLTLMWQRAAYAHRLPELSDVKKTCDLWSGIFMVKTN